MPTQLSDEQLLAQRARRTGRPIPATNAPGGPAGPDAPRQALNPLEGMPGFEPGDLTPPTPTPTPTPQPTPPQPTAGADVLAAMQSQLNALTGRLGPTQQQLVEAQEANRALAESNAALQAQLAATAAANQAAAARQQAESFDPFAGLSAEQLADLDPTVVNAMRMSARAALSQAMASIKDPATIVNETLAQRDRQHLSTFLATSTEELGLKALAANPKFQAFTAADDSADMLLSSFLKAPNVDTARSLLPRVKGMLKRFEKSVASDATGDPPADPEARLAAHMARTPGDSPAPPSARQAVSPEQAAKLRREHSQAVRARDFKKADAIMAQLNS